MTFEMQQEDDVEDEDQMSEEDGDLETDSILHRLMEIRVLPCQGKGKHCQCTGKAEKAV